MKLQIDDDYRIRADTLQWILQKRTNNIDKRSGKIVWDAIGFFATLGGAVHYLHDLRVRTSDAESLAEALDVSRRVLQEIAGALQPGYRVVEEKEES